MESQGTGQKERKPHPSSGLPVPWRGKTMQNSPSHGAGRGGIWGTGAAEPCGKAVSPRGAAASCSQTPAWDFFVPTVHFLMGLRVVCGAFLWIQDISLTKCLRYYSSDLVTIGESGKMQKKKIKEETKKEGNGRERNIWREICPVLPEPTNPQDHPGYKWKHAKKKRGNAFHRAATFHLSALKMPGYHFQNLYKNTAFYPQFPLVTNHFLLAIHFKKLWQKSALGKQHVISIPRGKLVSSHSESWLVNKSINSFLTMSSD